MRFVNLPEHGTHMNESDTDEYSVEARSGVLGGSDLEKCTAIIEAGGAVAVDVAKLRQASALVLARKGSEIVGVASVKAMRPGYTAGIARKSGVTMAPETAELGYVAVDRAHQGQGLSHRLVNELLRSQKGALFATTDNPRMKRVLSSAGFQRKGHEWKGKRGQLSLWLRD